VSAYTLTNRTKKSTTSLLRTTLKNYKKIPRTSTKNLSPTLYNTVTLWSIKTKKYLNQKKPQPPDLRAQIKLHKSCQPVRPAVNKGNVPAFKMSKLLVNKLNNLLHLRNHYIVKDSTALTNDLTKLKKDENHKMITFISRIYISTYRYRKH